MVIICKPMEEVDMSTDASDMKSEHGDKQAEVDTSIEMVQQCVITLYSFGLYM